MDRPSPDKIGRMFSTLAPRYRRFNWLSSLGLDNQWRNAVVRSLAGCRRILDLGTGPGDLAWKILADRRGDARVTGLDLSAEMLEHARLKGDDPAPFWIQGGAAQLPFRNGAFDAVVSAFVLRNLHMAGQLREAIREAGRVIHAGGRLVFLDLTRPTNIVLRLGHGVYNRTALPAIGRAVFGPQWPGSYLAASIEALPGDDVMDGVFTEAGFSRFERRPLWGGVVSLFIGRK